MNARIEKRDGGSRLRRTMGKLDIRTGEHHCFHEYVGIYKREHPGKEIRDQFPAFLDRGLKENPMKCGISCRQL